MVPVGARYEEMIFIKSNVMDIVVVIVIFLIVVFLIGCLSNKTSNYEDSSSKTYHTTNAASKRQTYTMDNNLQVEVVGGFYRSYEAKQFIKKLSNGDNVYFLPEPSNPYDRNAVMVISETGLHIGYIKKEWAVDVNIELKKHDLRGWVYGEIESSYQFDIIIDSFCNTDKRDRAIRLYQEQKQEIIKQSEKEKLKWALNFDEKVAKAKILYRERLYSEVESILRPIFDAGVQNCISCELLIKALHAEKKYEEEEKLIDEYLVLKNCADKLFWKRRKFHILRATGVIVSDDQIESEKADVETTVLELDAFNIVVDILSEVVDVNRVDFRDAKSLFSVNLDSNTRKPICKFYLNNIYKMHIGIIERDKSVSKKQINSLEDIKKYSDQLQDTVLSYLEES